MTTRLDPGDTMSESLAAILDEKSHETTRDAEAAVFVLLERLRRGDDVGSVDGLDTLALRRLGYLCDFARARLDVQDKVMLDDMLERIRSRLDELDPHWHGHPPAGAVPFPARPQYWRVLDDQLANRWNLAPGLEEDRFRSEVGPLWEERDLRKRSAR